MQMRPFAAFTVALVSLLSASRIGGIRETRSHRLLCQPTTESSTRASDSTASGPVNGLSWLRWPSGSAKKLNTTASDTLPPLSEAKASFLAAHGGDYGYQGWLDAYWQKEVGVRLPRGQHYLDYTGSALYANTQVKDASQMLLTEAFGNPHSRNPSSYRSAKMEEAARKRVLQWLGADEKDYVLVWTRSATEALKMVGEWFPWSAKPDYQPLKDVPPGGVSNKFVGHVSKCGGPLYFIKDQNTGKASHFVYTR
eukprot:GHUV01005494.1.p1 GENE.GHUV01005494.1~~GHUV01005494.1.p1  ORF type:complete len:253 (+),score=38.33 GHUV01005494.1:272-1030(+)